MNHQAKAKAVLEQGGGKATGKRKKARTKQRVRDNYAENSDITQDAGMQYAPPGGSVWRAFTGRQAWCGHYPPMPRCSKTFGDGQTSCRGALGDVCINLWAHHIVATGLEVADVVWDFACI